MDDLDRMIRRLVQVIRAGYPELLTRPFDVAELYQVLIPYRHNRRELQIETNQDYEMALLRLLSGERGYLIADERMQEALRQELASPNPDTSAFRGYATAQIAVSPDVVRRLEGSTADADESRRSPASDSPPAAAPAEPARASSDRRPLPTAAPAPSTAAAPASAAVSSGRPVPSRIEPTRAAAARAPAQDTMTTPQRTITARDVGGSCRYCGGALPEGRRLTFCPHCGQNLTVQHCPACGTELEVGWKFCTNCGRSVATE